MEILVIAGLLGLIPALIAAKKRRSFVLWWFYGTLMLIVALPMAIMLKAQNTTNTNEPQEKLNTKQDNIVPRWLTFLVFAALFAAIWSIFTTPSHVAKTETTAAEHEVKATEEVKTSIPDPQTVKNTEAAGKLQTTPESISSNPENQASTTVAKQPTATEQSQAEETNAEQEQPKGQQWLYQKQDDAMTGNSAYYARVISTNTANFSFPYEGEQNASLTLRNHPRYGKDIIFSIEKGQLLCMAYEGCTVLVRFDDRKAQKYSANAPADNSTETVFISNFPKFLAELKKSKIVRISANVYQEGNPIFEFDVSDFDSNKIQIPPVKIKKK